MLAAKFEAIFPHLDERQRRLLLGPRRGRWAMAGSGWWPGLPGSARPRCPWALMSWTRAPGRWAGRGGRAGAASGRPIWIRGWSRRCWPWSSRRAGRPDVAAAVDGQVHPHAGGRADGPGHKVSADTVGDLLREEGFSLQGNAKTLEGAQHPDRDAQFRYLC